jgi:hypothetical protein
VSADAGPKPYRVEWRAHYNQTWMFIIEVDTHETALALADKSVEERGGTARVLSQHVIHRADYRTVRTKRR